MKGKLDMKKDTVSIGFIGVQQEDLAIWCSVFLAKMEKKVLLIDFTTQKSLSYVFPLPEGYSKISDTEFEHRGIYFVNAGLDSRIEDFSSGYDVVIAVFGKKVNHQDLKYCDVLYAVTNLETRNVERLKDLKHYENQYLILRDFIRGSHMDGIIREELGYEKDQIFLLERNETEYRQYVHSQWSQEMVIHGISFETKELLLHIAEQIKLNPKVCQITIKTEMKKKVSGW